MQIPIQFHFRCTAFGVSYYNCNFTDANGKRKTVEVCFKDGFVEEHPVLTYNYNVQITDTELLSAWKDFCAKQREKYLAWLEENPACKEFSKLASFRD